MPIGQPVGSEPVASGSPDRPDDLDRARRLDWARLLARTFSIDVLVCPRCGGPTAELARHDIRGDSLAEPELLDPPFDDDTDPA